MKISRAYRTELDPTNVQRTSLVRHAGTARYAYNWGLSRKEQTYLFNQLPHPPVKTPTAIDLHRELNRLKSTEFPWMYEVSKCAPQEALRNLDAAYQRFFDCRKGKCALHWNPKTHAPKGKARCGHPRLKSRKNGLGSFRLTGAIHVEEDHIVLPRIGGVRLKEHGYLPEGTPCQVTVSERAGRWFVSVTVEEEQSVPAPPSGEVVGVDLGISALATVSDGTVFENPRALAHRLRKLQHLQREVSRKKKGSHNREKAKCRLSRCHARVADLRKDVLHKATTMLARTKSVVVVESLRPANMVKNHALAGSIQDASFGEFVRQLEYKCRWYGSRLVKADPFYPSTKLCSGCGALKEMPLSEGTYSCPWCGLVMGRDLNASRNLAMVAASSAETENACGERSSMPAMAGASQGIRNPSSTVPVTVV